MGEWVGLRTGNHAHFLLTYHFICLFFSQHILSIPSQSYPVGGWEDIRKGVLIQALLRMNKRYDNVNNGVNPEPMEFIT